MNGDVQVGSPGHFEQGPVHPVSGHEFLRFLDRLRAEREAREKLKRLEADLEACGGRGVDLAEEIDELRKSAVGVDYDSECPDEDAAEFNT